MASYCSKCGREVHSNYCITCDEKIDKRTGTRLGLIFMFIALLILAFSSISTTGAFLEADYENEIFLILMMISFIAAPILYYTAAGAFLGGRNDLDGRHRLRTTLGAMAWMLAPLLALFYFTLFESGIKSFYIRLALIHSVMALTLGLGNYLLTCHLTEDFYFRNVKNITRYMVRGAFIFLCLIIVIYLIGNIYLVSANSTEDIIYSDHFDKQYWNIQAISTALMTFYFLSAGLTFLILFFGLSGGNMNEEAISMGRERWQYLEYDTYMRSMEGSGEEVKAPPDDQEYETVRAKEIALEF